MDWSENRFNETASLITNANIKYTKLYLWTQVQWTQTGKHSAREGGPGAAQARAGSQTGSCLANFPLYTEHDAHGLWYPCEPARVSCPGWLQTANGLQTDGRSMGLSQQQGSFLPWALIGSQWTTEDFMKPLFWVATINKVSLLLEVHSVHRLFVKSKCAIQEFLAVSPDSSDASCLRFLGFWFQCGKY